MVFQDYALWPQLNVLTNVVYALKRLRLPHEESQRLALAMLDRVGLARLANRRPAELSGGEQQRVALARAMVARPVVLLCDEPLSHLDADLRERLRAEIVGAYIRYRVEHGRHPTARHRLTRRVTPPDCRDRRHKPGKCLPS
jgi:ABC-type Fe3+/spermidine/putrescine transport system ATPase subunit